jgi:hypothetical protein
VQGSLLKKARQMAHEPWEREVMERTGLSHAYTVAVQEYIDQLGEVVGRGSRFTAVTRKGQREKGSSGGVPMGSLHDQAAKIDAMVDKAQGKGLFGRGKSNYIKRLLQPEMAVQYYLQPEDEESGS